MSHGRHNISNNRQLDCLFKRLFRPTGNIKALHHWSIVWGIHWSQVDALLTKGQLCGKGFLFMTSPYRLILRVTDISFVHYCIFQRNRYVMGILWSWLSGLSYHYDNFSSRFKYGEYAIGYWTGEFIDNLTSSCVLHTRCLKYYTYGPCFFVYLSLYTDPSIFIQFRVTLLALGQWRGCSSASEASSNNLDQYG